MSKTISKKSKNKPQLKKIIFLGFKKNHLKLNTLNSNVLLLLQNLFHFIAHFKRNMWKNIWKAGRIIKALWKYCIASTIIKPLNFVKCQLASNFTRKLQTRTKYLEQSKEIKQKDTGAKTFGRKTSLGFISTQFWHGVQWDQAYIMGRRCLFSLCWPPF